MSKVVAYAFTAALIFAPSLAVAQVSQMQGAQAESRDLTDIRVDVVKSALQLSPEQTQYWPAIEGAMRARAETRRQKVENVSDRMEEARPDRDRDFVRALQKRADNLSERSTELRKLADAWQPLTATLSDTQKRRMRILAALVLHEVREDRDVPRIQFEDDQIWGAMTGSGSGESGVGR
jgi:hypothetical protein